MLTTNHLLGTCTLMTVELSISPWLSVTTASSQRWSWDRQYVACSTVDISLRPDPAYTTCIIICMYYILLLFKVLIVQYSVVFASTLSQHDKHLQYIQNDFKGNFCCTNSNYTVGKFFHELLKRLAALIKISAFSFNYIAFIFFQ